MLKSFGLLLLLSFSTADFAEENDVKILTGSNFDEALGSTDYVMVMFFAPWCGHCNALKPEYEKAATQLKAKYSNVMVAKVDATVESDLASKYSVTGYPTLYFFKKGVKLSYKAERSADALVKFIERKMGPSVQQLSSVAEHDEFVKSKGIAVVGYIQAENADNRKAFETVSEENDDYSFAIVSDQEVMKALNIQQDSVHLHKPFDEKIAKHDGKFTSESIATFIAWESIPLVVDFEQESAGKVFGSPVKKHVVTFAHKSQNYDSLKETMTTVAKDFKGKVHFIFIDCDVEDNARIMDFFGLNKADVPTYRLIDLADDMVKYKSDSAEFTVPLISAFVQNVLDGKQKPFLMSAEVPAESSDPVRVLVGKNYNEVTSDLAKAVFVELYAPWCGHCKQLAPIWEQLGEAYKGNEHIIIAKMDATANEAEGLKIVSFPTLKYYPKGSDKAIEYNGERTFDALKAFVDSDGTSQKETQPPVEDEEEDEEPKDEL